MAGTQIPIYGDSVREVYARNTVIDQLVNVEDRKEITESQRGTGVVFEYQKMADGTTSTLTANTAETPSGSTTTIPVTILANEYGAGADAEIIPGGLYKLRYAVSGQLENKLRVQGNKAATAINAIGLNFVHTAIGGANNTAYVHPLGPDVGSTQFSSPVASKLVRYGTQTNSRAGYRADIDANDVYSVTWLRRQKARLMANKAFKGIMNTDMGTPIVALCAHEFVMNDLLTSMTFDSFPTVTDFISMNRLAERGLNLGMIGIFEGVLLIQSNDMVYAGAGAGGIDVYPAVMVAGGFLGKVFAPPSELPDPKADGSKYDVPEGAAVYLEPYGSIHGQRQATVSWLAYLGYGVFDPLAAHRLEVASTTGLSI